MAAVCVMIRANVSLSNMDIVGKSRRMAHSMGKGFPYLLHRTDRPSAPSLILLVEFIFRIAFQESGWRCSSNVSLQRTYAKRNLAKLYGPGSQWVSPVAWLPRFLSAAVK